MILVGDAELGADVAVPDDAHGVVVFAHGSGSSRHSTRNRHVAEQLQDGGLATVLVDLLSIEEEAVDARTAEHRFDIDLLAPRVTVVTDWTAAHPLTRGLGLGLFGASTGAAAAFVSAARRPTTVLAVVSRGGRTDLAAASLARVRQPALLIVGRHDTIVLEHNRHALAQLGGDARLEIVPRATHLFEEPGALDTVAKLARDWFDRHLHLVPPHD
jgi:putative phosphoribosyl transferase